MDGTYGTYVDDECSDTHDYDGDTDHDNNDDTDDGADDDTNDDTDDDDDGGRGNRRPLLGGAVHFLSPLPPPLGPPGEGGGRAPFHDSDPVGKGRG